MTPHPPLPAGLLADLGSALPADALLTAPPALEAYAWDNTGVRHRPQAVALCATEAEVAAVLRLCHHARVAVTPRGAGTGNVGGALALLGGVVLSTQRMNRILEVDPLDRLAVVEPGVVNAHLQEALRPRGLFWPPDPSSARSCTVGGNLAMCAAGPNAIRYGVTREWVLGLRAVLADGTPLTTGGRTTKGVVGYDLTRLLVGSEGTLAVITRATLKLAPRPPARRLLRAVFAGVGDAAAAVATLMGEGEPPSAVEFLDPATLDLLRRGGTVPLPPEGRAMLLVEASGSVAGVDEQARALEERLARHRPLELVRGGDGTGAAQLWAAREAISPTLKSLAPRRINEDVVVPVSRLPDLIAGLEELSAASAIPIVNFGHAGNGNIHVNLLVDPADPALMGRVEETLDRLFRLVLSLEGSLSGEHGVGIQKRRFVSWELDPVALDLMKRIKGIFDPEGVLNPAKALPEAPGAEEGWGP